MRLRTFLAVAFSILLFAPLMADDLQFESNANGVKVQGKHFRAIAAHMSIDIANGTLTLDGTKDTPAKFIRAAFGPKDGPTTTASRIIYDLNDEKLKIYDIKFGKIQ